MKLILASASPRREQLLNSLGLEFETVAPDVDELRLPGEEPYDYVERIARLKSAAVGNSDAVIIAADTTVVSEGRVLGKPIHPDEARHMLARLSGTSHEVLTGVAVRRGEETISAVESTIVRFLPLTEEEIAEYVANGEPMDKAGAYALGGLGGLFVDRVEGSPSNVIGLPLHTTARLCRALGVDLLTFRRS
ncbi:MAG: septum formation inhibitor Maf [Acidimicrobiia bacterium]|nr:septum formation inhibitor Maf [Acidimicrobiia bacterium]